MKKRERRNDPTSRHPRSLCQPSLRSRRSVSQQRMGRAAFLGSSPTLYDSDSFLPVFRQPDRPLREVNSGRCPSARSLASPTRRFNRSRTRAILPLPSLVSASNARHSRVWAIHHAQNAHETLAPLAPRHNTLPRTTDRHAPFTSCPRRLNNACGLR
jgi:hypothetical protein